MFDWQCGGTGFHSQPVARCTAASKVFLPGDALLGSSARPGTKQQYAVLQMWGHAVTLTEHGSDTSTVFDWL